MELGASLVPAMSAETTATNFPAACPLIIAYFIGIKAAVCMQMVINMHKIKSYALFSAMLSN